MKKKSKVILIVVLVALVAFIFYTTTAQKSGISRTDLQRQDLSIPGKEVHQLRVDFEEGAEAASHYHPGEEIIYVLQGVIEYSVEGREPVTLKAGGILFIPAGKIHSAKNVGQGEAQELATYIVEKGKPLINLVE